MTRSADYAIQGFLYQFNKTLLEVLKSPDDALITVEGIIEDIEVWTPDRVTAIQCKYHETNEKFTLSVVYKPLIQMMHHFHLNPGGKIDYRLFAFLPNEAGDSIPISKADLEKALNSKNKDFKEYIKAIKGKVDLDIFLKNFSFQLGKSFDELVAEVGDQLQQCGMLKDDIETIFYPNAIQAIADLSIKHAAKDRVINKKKLVASLHEVKKTAISRWTLALKSRKELLEARRKQLKLNLDKNSRLRHFVVYAEDIEEFEAQIVLFVSDYLDKYHTKPAHINTPLLCLVTNQETFETIQLRLHQKGIIWNDGYVANVFDEGRFFRDPMIQRMERGQIKREFSLRILRWDSHRHLLNKRKADDLFILGKGDLLDLNIADVNVEHLASASLAELKFMIGIANVC